MNRPLILSYVAIAVVAVVAFAFLRISGCGEPAEPITAEGVTPAVAQADETIDRMAAAVEA
ncbi:MAG TPA: hypothetical protein VF594_06245, partial [Rubricoccaceae bacterium]